ncbi:MAG: hypothetical protein WC852_05300 [Candidatus Nanoarchaeia archaeon]|jgi:hypothetical protein
MKNIETLIQNSKDAQKYEELKQQLKDTGERLNQNLATTMLGGTVTGIFAGVGACADDSYVAKTFFSTFAAVCAALTYIVARTTSHYSIEFSKMHDRKNRIEAKYTFLEKKADE